MDLHKRLSNTTGPGRVSPFGMMRVAFFVVLALPLLLLGYFASEFRILSAGWPWRNAQATKALITSHELSASNPNSGLPEFGLPPRKDTHTFTYVYASGDLEYTGELSVHSMSETTIDLGAKDFAPIEGAKFPVYFRPDDPAQHEVFFDPRIPFRRAVWRIGTGAGVCFSLMLMVGLIVTFYRPNKRDKSRLPEKLELG